jgi:hypothetical protein
MAKPLLKSTGIRNTLRNQAKTSILLNRTLKNTLANQPVRGNFRTLLSFYPKDPIDKQKVIDKYEEIPNKSRQEIIDPSITQAIETLTANAKDLQLVIKHLDAKVQALKGKQ